MSSSIAIPRIGDRVLVTVALLVFAAATHTLVTYRPAYDGAANLVQVGTVEVDGGAIRRRHAGSLAWAEIDYEGDIFLRDLVYTPPGVTAIVRMKDGRQMALPADSLVQFDDITVSNLEITLKELAEPKRQVFRLVPLPKARKSMTLPDPLPLEMMLAELTTKLSESSSKGPLGITQPRVVGRDPSFALNQMLDYEIKLQYPADGASLPYDRDAWQMIAWSPVPLKNIGYQIEMSLKEKFEKKLPYNSRINSLEIQFDKPGKYYWRVVAAGPSGIMTSEVRTFTLFPRGRRDVAEDVTATEFSQFFVEVGTNEDFDPVLTSRGAKEPKCTTVGLPPGKYYCRVKRGKDKSVFKVFSFEVK